MPYCRPRSILLLTVFVILWPFLGFALVDRSSTYQTSQSSVGLMSSLFGSNNPSLKPLALPANVTNHVCLSYEDRESAQLAITLLNSIEADDHPDLRDSTKSIKVNGSGSLANFTAISSAIRSIKELKELDWQNKAPLPGVILKTLSTYHPDCRLRYDMQFSNWDMYADDYVPIQAVGDEPHRDIRARARRLIVGSTNLHALKAHIGYGSQPDAESLKLIRDILTDCPNLRELDLSISHDGCVFDWPQPYSFDFTQSSAPFTPLEVLKLQGYRLDDPYEGQVLRYRRVYPGEDELRWPWKSLPSWIVYQLCNLFEPLLYDVIKKPRTPKPDACQSVGCCEHSSIETTNLDGWLERMDFSKLQTVDLGSMSVVSLLKLQKANVLTNVSTLHLHGGNKCFADLLPDFMTTLRKPLSTLCLRSIDFSNISTLVPSIAKHGDSLTSLHLTEHQESRLHWCHQDEPGRENSLLCRAFGRGTWYDPHVYLNTSSLLDLSSACPKLTHLDIDLDRNATTLMPDYSALAILRNLSSLTLRFESPTFQRTRAGIRPSDPRSDADILFDPLFNKSSVLNMFQQLRQSQREHAFQARDSLSSGSRISHAPLPTPRPALHDLTVYIGDFASRHSHGMMLSERYVLGKFHCALGSTGEEVCTGGITFPSDTIMGYDDSYAYGIGINQSRLDKDGLWDPSMESEASTYKRRLRAAEEGVEEIKSAIGLKKQYHDWKGTMEALSEVLGLVEQELKDLRGEAVDNVADGNELVSAAEEVQYVAGGDELVSRAEEAVRLRHGRMQGHEDEEEADIRELQRQMA